MKSVFAMLCLILVMVAPSFAQDSTFMTDNFINGRFWQKLSADSKAVYLSGFQDGGALAWGLSESREKIPVDLAPGLTVNELIVKIDAFYMLKDTEGIPVIAAIMYAGHEKAGDSKEILQKYLDDLRAKANGQAPPSLLI